MSPRPSDDQTIEQILLEVRKGEALPVVGFVDLLLELGPGGVALLVETAESKDAPGGALHPSQCEGLKRDLRGVPAETARRLRDESHVERRVLLASIGLEVLARAGTARDVELTFELAAPHPAVSRRDHRRIQDDLVATLAEILRREDASHARLSRLFREIPSVNQASLLEAVGDAPSPASMRFLAARLGESPLDGLVLTQLGLVALDVATPLDEMSLVRVRPFLRHETATTRSQAAQALGRLDDYGSIAGLIELLADEHAGTRRMAHWSLRSITAMTYSLEPNRWRMWFQNESRWWEERSPAVLERLNSRRVVDVVAAINEVAKKRLYRRELTPLLVPLLRDRDERIVRMACSALESLRAAGVEPDLVELLRHPEAGVREHAHRTLVRLTGNRLPPDPNVWHQEYP
ncbi:MAG: hypothetical protein GY711_18185 [bacterium]|nr:hypothetical protein [bacterium]